MNHHDSERAHITGHMGVVEQIPVKPSTWETKEEHIASSDYSKWAFPRRFGVQRWRSWFFLYHWWGRRKAGFHGLDGSILGAQGCTRPFFRGHLVSFCVEISRL